jgi:hypothetical protein
MVLLIGNELMLEILNRWQMERVLRWDGWL